MARPVRVRYAPSPTGYLHLGGLRTAVYNYAFARHHGGKFLLRIEDTDRSRQVPGSIESLIAALRWCGVDYDEGPEKGGPHGPYIQSQRLQLYANAADKLLASGHAYRCFCSSERLDSLRKSQAKRGRIPLYDRACARLPAGESDRRAAAGEPHVVRLMVPSGHSVVDDAVRGSITFNNSDVDDQILLKSDGWPTYHLASVVDDTDMGISHVIRGQEWLPSTPKHTILYAALGVPPPIFAHLPILLNPDRSKLSKRQGDAAVEDFRAAGYTPEALVHFVSLLGWTPPNADAANSLVTLDDLCASFSLASVHKGDSIVDRAKLDSINNLHIRRGVATALGKTTGAGNAGGAAEATANGKPKQAPLLPVQVADTPFLASVRADIGPGVDAAVATLLSSNSEGATATAPVNVLSRLPVDRLNAVLVAQHERVRPLSDFTDLCLPFLLDDGAGQASAGVASGQETSGAGTSEWAVWMTRPQALSSARKIVEGKGAKGSGGGPAAAGAPGAAPTPGAPGAPADAQPSELVLSLDERLKLIESVASINRAALQAVLEAWQAEQASTWQDATPEGEARPMSLAKAAAKASGVPIGKLMLQLRFLLTGMDVGAGLGDTVRLLGRDSVTARLRWALALASSAGQQ